MRHVSFIIDKYTVKETSFLVFFRSVHISDLHHRVDLAVIHLIAPVGCQRRTCQQLGSCCILSSTRVDVRLITFEQPGCKNETRHFAFDSRTGGQEGPLECRHTGLHAPTGSHILQNRMANSEMVEILVKFMFTQETQYKEVTIDIKQQDEPGLL